MGLAASRISFRLLDQTYADHIRDIKPGASVIIYGADDAGVMALQWLSYNPKNKYDAIGFLDDDPFKQGRQIQGISIIGNLDDLSEIIEKYEFQGIIIPSDQMIEIFKETDAVNICKEHGIWLKRLKVNFHAIE